MSTAFYKRMSFMFMIIFMIHDVDSLNTDIRHWKLTDLERKMLDTLCPDVDICDENATSADLLQHGVSHGELVSCCKSCSCHSDCREKINCCFQDKVNRPEITSPSMNKCLRARIGQPEADIPMSMPGYVTVVSAPHGGCVDNKPLKIGQGQLVNPTCNNVDNISMIIASTLVYSTDTDDIYKNVLCARCHGVTRMIPFDPLLVCKRNGENGFQVSLTEQMAIFETGILSRNCFIDFIFGNKSAFSNKECYVHVISVCETSEVTSSIAAVVDNLDFEAVQSMCKNGVYSPVLHFGRVYRNVFCSLCGLVPFTSPMCQTFSGEKSDPRSLTYFIDNTKVLRQRIKYSENGFPNVCLLPIRNPETHASCRPLYCSSGKTRGINGKCSFVSRTVEAGSFVLLLKLIPKNRRDSIHRNGHIVDTQQVNGGLLRGKPFSDDWRIFQVLERDDDSECADHGEFIVGSMTNTVRNLYELHRDIETSIRRPWIITVNGSFFMFKQNFQEYMLVASSQGYYHVPVWQIKSSTNNRTSHYFGCDSMKWKVIHSDFGITKIPVKLNKLILCEQIQLNPGEFTVTIEDDEILYLKSNLTRRILYNFEFDLIMRDEYHARVCLADTIFSRKVTNSGSCHLKIQTGTISFTTIILLLQKQYMI